MINMIFRALALIIVTCLTRACEKQTTDQNGFEPERGRVDQISVLHQVLEHKFANQLSITTVFFDLKAVFSSVDRKVLW